MNLPDNISERISGWIAERAKSAGARGVVLGLSGGLDYSVTAILCEKTLGEEVLALFMPCHSDHQDLEHAKMLAEKFGIRTETIDLTETYNTITRSLPKGDRIAKANIKPRLRMLTLYYFANLHKYLVVGTGNKTEILTGYSTKYGDSAADLLPLGGLYKTQVTDLAIKLGIPREIIDKEPSAGLWPNQTDEKEMGIAYEELDRILEAIEKNNTKDLDQDKLQRVKDMINKSEHKREAPPICKV